MFSAMKTIIKIAMCCIFLCVAHATSRAASTRSVEVIYRIANRIPGPSLEDYKNANTEVAYFLAEKVGMNVACYIAPTKTGHAIVWIDEQSPLLTSEVRLAAEEIVRRNLNGERTEPKV
jgi:hypothetical protein